MAYRVHTEIEIDAPPERVWTVLTDSPALPEWNPVMTQIDGELREGADLRVKIKIMGRVVPLKVRVSQARQAEALEWVGGLSYVLRARHGFRIEPLADGRARLVHYETFEGAAVLLLGGVLSRLNAEYERMNLALKARCES